jgi:hypothetical protein
LPPILRAPGGTPDRRDRRGATIVYFRLAGFDFPRFGFGLVAITAMPFAQCSVGIRSSSLGRGSG